MKIDNDRALLIRTDYSNDEKWNRVIGKFQEEDDLGYCANVSIISNKALLYNLYIKDIIEVLQLKTKYTVGYIFVADNETFKNSKSPILAVNIDKEKSYPSFRFIPSVASEVDNNLYISNMDFEEFVEMAEVMEDRIFAGFQKFH